MRRQQHLGRTFRRAARRCRPQPLKNARSPRKASETFQMLQHKSLARRSHRRGESDLRSSAHFVECVERRMHREARARAQVAAVECSRASSRPKFPNDASYSRAFALRAGCSRWRKCTSSEPHGRSLSNFRHRRLTSDRILAAPRHGALSVAATLAPTICAAVSARARPLISSFHLSAYLSAAYRFDLCRVHSAEEKKKCVAFFCTKIAL